MGSEDSRAAAGGVLAANRVGGAVGAEEELGGARSDLNRSEGEWSRKGGGSGGVVRGN